MFLCSLGWVKFPVPDYAIGDVQGCYDALQRLLVHIAFDDRRDRLWFVGDLVNRGPQSLETLRFIKGLPIKPRISLGNHDLHFLARLFAQTNYYSSADTLDELLSAPDCDELGHWLRQQPLLHFDETLNVAMSHAGLAPCWSLEQAKSCARELETVLSSDAYADFLTNMYGNEADHWQDGLVGLTRLQTICNYFTRMRFCDVDGRLDLSYKGELEGAPAGLYPWYRTPHRRKIQQDIVFGHWASLAGELLPKGLYGIDTGCIWGGALTALRLQDRRCFSVKAPVCHVRD